MAEHNGAQQDSIVITGVGMMTSVGFNMAQADASIRAGISQVIEYPSYVPIVRDPARFFPEPLIAAPVAGLTEALTGIERLFALATPAAKEAMTDAELDTATVSKTSLVVAGGQAPGRGIGSRLATVFVPRLAQRLTQGHFEKTAYLPVGTAGFLIAMRQAMQWLREEQCTHCLIGGIDTWLELETLKWLDEARRLKSDSNPDGFIPGEAAAFVVVELKSTSLKRGKQPYAECSGVSVAQEKNTIWAEDPCTADALSAVLTEQVNALNPDEQWLDAILCDLNGESYRSVEWAYALTRVFQEKPEPPPLTHPADCLGDVGAAIGGVLAAMSATAIGGENPFWSSALLWCSSDNGERAAALVRSANEN